MRHGYHAQPLLIEIVSNAADTRQQHIGQRHNLTVELHQRTNRQHFFQRAFANQAVILVVFGDDDRHTATVEIKRNFIHFQRVMRRTGIACFQHRNIQQVFQAGLIMAVQPRQMQHLITGHAQHISVALEHDFILRQRAGFIRAEDIHCAEVLYRIQTFDDHLLAGEFYRAFGQRGSHNHRQHFRRQPDRHGERKQCGFPPVAFGVTVDHQHHRCHYHHKADQQPADFADPGLERVWLCIFLYHTFGKLTEPGFAAGGDHHRNRRAAHHVGAHKTQGVQFKRISRNRFFLAGVFFHRQGFTGQRRLADKQILGRKNAQVCRDHIAR